MTRSEVIALYERVAAARIEDTLIADAVMEACRSRAAVAEQETLVARLTDDDHVKVLRKEVTDVVILVTGAMEAPSEEVYRDFVAYVDQQVPLESFDDATAVLREVLARKMAECALDDVVDDRALMVDRLRLALQALGIAGDPLGEAEAAEAGAGAP